MKRERGPLEAEVNKMMWDAFHGDPEVLEAQLDERDEHNVIQTLHILLRASGTHRACLLRIAREVDDLASRL